MNELFSKKIENIHKNLLECHRDTQLYAPSITGGEREIFNRELFQRVLPTNFRVGAGSIVDNGGRETGQIDAVIELPFSLSFPISSGDNRLYLAGCVGAAFEIKSDLNKQWDEAVSKIEEIKRLNKKDYDDNEIILLSRLKIPSFIIAFKGPKSLSTIEKKLLDINVKYRPDGVLIIDQGVFYGQPSISGSPLYTAKGDKQSILAFIDCLYKCLWEHSDSTADLFTYSSLL